MGMLRNEKARLGNDNQCNGMALVGNELKMQRMSKDRHRAAMSGNGKATLGNVPRGLSNVCEKFF